MRRTKSLIVALGLCALFAVGPARAETPEQWVSLGRRVHGEFGTYVALGLRVGLDAVRRLGAEPHGVDVTFQSGPKAPCACAADGLMLATGATPGRGLLHVLPARSGPDTFGVAVVKNVKTGKTLRYVLLESAHPLLDRWNTRTERQRYDAVMKAPPGLLFRRE